ncbi:putative solute carrier family 13 [Helianthus anomalus]
MLRHLPVGAWAFICLMITVMTKTLTVKDALLGFTNDIIWLIVVSFFFSRGFVKTGLNDRFTTYFVKWFGKSTLGLTYELAIGESIILLAMPSVIAKLVEYSCPLSIPWPSPVGVVLPTVLLVNLTHILFSLN